MFSADQYELVDFGKINGEGRKLEKINGILVSRPSPAASRARIRDESTWKQCDLIFSESRAGHSTGNENKGSWKGLDRLPETWELHHPLLKLRLKPTPFGHLGVFAEQQANWDWINRQVQARSGDVRVLNLFAYTGGSTLAAAAAGAEVVHIDSAKNIVQWARQNAELSGLEEAPIRWITEDSHTFVKREIKRGNKYDAIILDPPSFGRGPKGETWKIDRDLIQMLRDCKHLLSDSPAFLLLSSHSPGFGPAELQATLCDSIFGTCSIQVNSSEMSLKTTDGRRLNAGYMAKWPR